MSISTILTVSFGSSRSGLVGRVAYSLDGGSNWITSGVTEPVAGSGNYQVSATVTPPLVVNWKTGDGDTVSPVLTQTAGGSGYTNGTGYALGFSGGSGTGAAGTFDVVAGAVTNLVLTAAGSGYVSAPTLSFPGAGSGSGAAATATLVQQRYASVSIGPVIAASVTGDVGGNVAGSVASVAGNVGGNVVGSVATVLSGVPANVIHSGTARGGSATTITLDTGASSIDNTYQMNQVYLSGGTGVGQTAVIIYNGYVGSTRVATVSAPWATIPDSTTTFQVIPQGAVVLGQIGGGTRTVTQDYLGTDSLTVLSQATGDPIESAAVTAYLASAFSSQGTNAPVIDSTTTDASGHWTLRLSPSAYVLVFSFASESSQATFTVS